MGDIALGIKSENSCMVDSNCNLPGIICEYCADADNIERMELTFYYCVEHRGVHFQKMHKDH